MSSNKVNAQSNILVNQNYNQDLHIHHQEHNEEGPVEINEEYYQNYPANLQEEHQDQQHYEDQEGDDNHHYQEEGAQIEEGDEEEAQQEEYEENNQGGEELYVNQLDAQHHQQGIQSNFQTRIQAMQQQQQQQHHNYLQQAAANFEKRGNFNQQINYDNHHIREQTEEDHYDEQMINQKEHRHPQVEEDHEDNENAENNNNKNYQEYIKSLQKQQELFQHQSQEKDREYKNSIQQKRYNQPQQYIDFKTSPRNPDINPDQQLQQDTESNQQLDEQESPQEQEQYSNEQKQHYFDGQKKLAALQQQGKGFQNNASQKYNKNISGSALSQQEQMTNNSNIDDNSKSIMSKIKQDESQLETSQANDNPYDDPYNQKKHLLDSPGNIELIKHSKYYQKYLNGESLNESYSILPSQTNQNLPSLQNSTSFGDPKALAAALDLNLQGNELYMLRIKLFESNNKLMQEINKNKILIRENQEMKLTINNLQFQLQSAQTTIDDNHKQISDYQIRSQGSHQQSQQQMMMNTFSSPVKSPTFENQGQSIQNDASQHRNIQLEEEQNKNFNLRQDLENLRTRLLQEMNNTNQYEQQIKEHDRVIKEQQYQLQEKATFVQSKNEEIRKLVAQAESYRVEISNLNQSLGKVKIQEEDIIRQNREYTSELNKQIAENKNLSAKLQNYNQDNLRLFSEIQILKQKLEKTQGQVVNHQNQIYNQKAEVSQQYASYVSNKQHNTTVDKFQIEITELKSSLVQTSKQLELQQERNEYLSVRLEEAEKLNRQFHSQKSQTQSSTSTTAFRKNSPQKYPNESDLEYKQRILEHKMIEKSHQLERDYQQKQLDIITQYASNQNPTKYNHEQQQYYTSGQRVDTNEKTLRKSYNTQQQNYENVKSRNLDEHNQQYSSQQKLRQSQQQQIQSNNYYPQNQNINPNQYNQYPSNAQQQPHDLEYETVKRVNNIYVQEQQQQNQQQLPQQYSTKSNVPSQEDHRVSSPPPRNVKKNNPPNPNHDYLFYQDLEEEKHKLQKQPQFIPIGVTSINEEAYVSNTQKIKNLDYYLNQLLQKKKLAESELLKLEENKRKSSMIITQKQELDSRILSYSQEISSVKNQLRNLHALK